MGSQVGLRKHRNEQSYWRWWNSSWASSNPERWRCESAALNMPANLENSAVATGLEKVMFFFPIPKKDNAKECSNCCTIALISRASKVMLNILQASTIREPWTSRCFNLRSNCQHPLDHRKSKRVPEKHLFLIYWLCQSLWPCGKFWKSTSLNTRPPDLPLEKSICRSGSNS